jgi:serine phosphatase RsbU (regulator of sigma subunit)
VSKGGAKGEVVYLAAADCTGHGVPGAMVSVICNNGLNRSLREYGITDPGKILDKTKEIVIEEFAKSDEEVRDGMDIALISLNKDSLELQYAGANNPLWIFRKNTIGETELIEVKPDNHPIGKYEISTAFQTKTFQLYPDDTFYIFTDGYQDQFGGEKGKKFKSAAMKRLLMSIQKLNMDAQKEFIFKTFEDWKGDLEQIDDICIIGVRL